MPIGVVLPCTPDAAVDAVAVAREFGAPVLSRGGGTSLAGQCTNAGVVIDWSKYCHRLESADVAAGRCVVQPGIVLDELNRRLLPSGLRFGPEPATHMNRTLGGMIGNNSCGATAQRTGKVVNNVAALEVLCYDGTRFWCGPTGDDAYAAIERSGGRRAEIHRRLRSLRGLYAEQIRTRFPDIPRRVSGYNLDSLLPEHGFDVAGLLVGSESTLVTVRPDTFEGWEDSAVPPGRLGDYLRRLQELYEEFGYAGDTGPALYGHFGQGCVHTRIPFDLYSAGGVADYRRFLERAADLVAEFGGSLSGEHGDGQTRGELAAPDVRARDRTRVRAAQGGLRPG